MNKSSVLRKLKGNSEMFHRFSFFFAVLLFLCLSFPYHHSDSLAVEKDAIKLGDKVGIQFTCRFPNGEIAASTSTAIEADPSQRKSVVFLPRSKDDPVKVTAGESFGAKTFPASFEDEMVSRISISLVGMTPGETRTMEIRSERPANVPEKEQFLQMALVRQRPKELTITRDEYKSRRGKEPEVGADYTLDPLIPGKVASVSENEVLVRFSAQPGTVVETPFGKGTIRENSNQYEIVIDAVKGRLVRTGPAVGCISDVQDRVFTVDYGHPFGGQPLSCEVRAENIGEEKLSKKGE
jgi:FKBP-type peptidyl-prolyl cis-trans isomerase 2